MFFYFRTTKGIMPFITKMLEQRSNWCLLSHLWIKIWTAGKKSCICKGSKGDPGDSQNSLIQVAERRQVQGITFTLPLHEVGFANQLDIIGCWRCIKHSSHFYPSDHLISQLGGEASLPHSVKEWAEEVCQQKGHNTRLSNITFQKDHPGEWLCLHQCYILL